MTGFDLNEKVAIITGAASGIGAATVHRFANAGARVIASDISDDVMDLASAAQGNGKSVIAVKADAGDETGVKSLIDMALEKYGRLDSFFANAGIAGQDMSGLFDTNPQVWAEILRVNLIGPYLAIHHCAAPMKAAGGGSIICTASVAGLRAGGGPGHYSASKAGVINLVENAARQLAGTNIRVNAICPGLIRTAMTKPIYDYAKEAGMSDQIGKFNPLLRDGMPDEIAAAAQFLASDAASYVNGIALPVDGGLSASLPSGSLIQG